MTVFHIQCPSCLSYDTTGIGDSADPNVTNWVCHNDGFTWKTRVAPPNADDED